MNTTDIIKALNKIIDGIEGDTFTADNIQALIKKIKEKPLSNVIQKELDEHVQTLNEEYLQYKVELTNDEDSIETVADLVRDADIDSIEFNIGFEQGYMRGLEVALSVTK